MIARLAHALANVSRHCRCGAGSPAGRLPPNQKDKHKRALSLDYENPHKPQAGEIVVALRICELPWRCTYPCANGIDRHLLRPRALLPVVVPALGMADRSVGRGGKRRDTIKQR
jgi:hypothetical protein